MLTLTEIKSFLGYDTDVHDAVLQTFQKAAEEHLKNGVNKDINLDDPRAKTLMLVLIRDMADSGDGPLKVSAITQRLLSSFTLQLSLESGAKKEGKM